MQPAKNYGESDAQKVIAMYGAELALMAATAIFEYPDLDPPGAIICEPGTSEGDSLIPQLDPRLPIRVVEAGVSLLIMSRHDLRAAIEQLSPGCLPYLEKDEFSAPGRLPILAVCRDGCLMGVAALPDV